MKYPLVRTRFPRIRDLSAATKKRYLVDARPLAARRCFETKAQAVTYADSIATERENQGVESLTFPTPQRVMAIECLKLLRPFEKSLADAVEFYVAHLQHERQRNESLLVSVCLAGFKEQLKGDVERGTLAHTSFKDSRMRIKEFDAAFGTLHLADLDERTVRAYLDQRKVGQRSRVNVRASLSKFFSWAISRGYVDRNPCAGIRLRVPSHDVTILSVAQASEMLKAAADSPLRAYVAIACLAGLRPTEIQRLDWRDVQLATTKTITVWKQTTKVRETRHVPINATLAGWLLPVAKASGSVTGKNWRFHFRDILKAAGFNKAHPYTPDSMRHSFASHWLPIHQNRAELAEIMGNSVRVIKTAYRAPVMADDARAYFALTPAAVRCRP